MIPLPQIIIEDDARGGGWVITHSGIRFFPLCPKPEEILIEDIAFSLSNINRFGGHVKAYSVAEHSCHVSDLLEDDLKLQGLLHDSAESYLGDMVRPLKQQLPDYCDIENSLISIIFQKFGLPRKIDPAVKNADNVMLITERNQLMPAGPYTRNWGLDKAGILPANVKIMHWKPEESYWYFLQRFSDLMELQRLGKKI